MNLPFTQNRAHRPERYPSAVKAQNITPARCGWAAIAIAAAVALLAGCGSSGPGTVLDTAPGSNNGPTAVSDISLVSLGSLPVAFRNAAFPAIGTSPLIPVPDSTSVTTTPGGSFTIGITTPAPVDDILVGVQGLQGFYDVAVGTQQLTRQPTGNATTAGSTLAGLGSSATTTAGTTTATTGLTTGATTVGATTVDATTTGTI